MSYFAQIVDGHVERVIVCDSLEWCESRLGGVWIETAIDAPDEQYAGRGMGFDPEHPRKFASEWQQPTHAEDAYPIGAYTFWMGKIWENITPANTHAPGTSGWREITDDGGPPAWIQPTGAHDAYPLDYEVSHIGAVWKSLIAANTTTPEVGSQFWELVSGEPEEPEGPEILPWQPNEAVIVGDLRSYNGTTYRVVQSHTTQSGWIPPVVPSLWEAI